MAAEIETNELLAHLKSLYPASSSKTDSDKVAQAIDNPWYIVAAVAFGASNRPEAVPFVFKFVVAELDALGATEDDKRRVVVRMREALFKTGLLNGQSRDVAISALIALYEATPEELRSTEFVRKPENLTVPDMLASGDEFFSAMHGENFEPIKSMFYKIHPDMGWFGRAIACGYVWSAQTILGRRETSFIFITSLIAMDTPTQLKWHLESARRAGASVEDVRAVREIAVRIAGACGVKWRNELPAV